MHETDHVVTVTVTIEDGPVARWYVHEAAAENGYDVMSVSRNGILVHTYLHNIPDPVMVVAKQTWQTLRQNRHADIGHLATHRHKYLMGREVEPMPRKPAVDAGRVPETGGPDVSGGVVYRTSNGGLVTLRVTGAPVIERPGNKIANRMLAEFVEFTIDNEGIDMVIVTGIGLRKDGKYGISRQARWWWRENRDEIPEWIQKLVRNDPAFVGAGETGQGDG